MQTTLAAQQASPSPSSPQAGRKRNPQNGVALSQGYSFVPEATSAICLRLKCVDGNCGPNCGTGSHSPGSQHRGRIDGENGFCHMSKGKTFRTDKVTISIRQQCESSSDEFISLFLAGDAHNHFSTFIHNVHEFIVLRAQVCRVYRHATGLCRHPQNGGAVCSMSSPTQ